MKDTKQKIIRAVATNAIEITTHQVLEHGKLIKEYGCYSEIPISQRHLINEGVYQLNSKEEIILF